MPELSTCQDLHKVGRLARGELPDAEAELFAQHVLTCLVCAEELNSLQTNDPFTKEVQLASASTPARDFAADELIDRLVRTPPEMQSEAFHLAGELRAAAMRRSLVARARLKKDEAILALDDALTKLQAVDDESARLVQLRYFAGFTQAEAADILGMNSQSADRLWAFAKAWLHRNIQSGPTPL